VFKVCYRGSYYGKVDDNQGSLGTLVGSMPSPYIPKTYSHFVHRRPLSPSARSSSSIVAHCPCRPVAPRPSSPIVLAAANALPSPSLTHPHCLVPPRPLSSRVLSRPPAHTCCSPRLVPFPCYPSCVRVRRTKAKSAKLDEVERTIV
jgi:hypothetical protein